jgi:hypothetical protein
MRPLPADPGETADGDAGAVADIAAVLIGHPSFATLDPGRAGGGRGALRAGPVRGRRDADAPGRDRYLRLRGHNPPYLPRAGGGVERLTRTGSPSGSTRPGICNRRDQGRGRRHAGPVQRRHHRNLQRHQQGIGEARLEAALRSARGGTAAENVAGVLQATREFAAGAEQSDDITCLALVFTPEGSLPAA